MTSNIQKTTWKMLFNYSCGALVFLTMIAFITFAILDTIDYQEKITLKEEFCESKGYEYKPPSCEKIKDGSVIRRSIVVRDDKVYWVESYIVESGSSKRSIES